MTNSGDHQMCSLKCGHVFCRTCLHYIFNIKPQCPICRLPFTTDDIRPIYIDGLPITDDMTVKLNQKIESSETQILALQQDLDSKNKLINDLRVQLQQAQANPISKFSNKPYSVSRPSLIIDSSILEGSRISISSTTVCASCNIFRTLSLLETQNYQNSINSMNSQNTQNFHSIQSNNNSQDPNYGIIIFPIQTPSSRSFLKLHTSPIRDLSFHSQHQKILSVSADHCIKVSDIEILACHTHYTCPIDLWCCSWIDDNCLASGGNVGWLYIADTRLPTLSLSIQRKGPPITSIATLDQDTLFCLSPTEGLIFDVRSSTFRKITGGGQSVKRCMGTPIIMVLSRDSIGASLNFYFRGVGGELSLTKTKKIVNNDRFIRPSITAMGHHGSAEIFFSCAGNNTNNDINNKRGFALYDFGKIDVDLWQEPSNAFSMPLHPSPIIDTCLAESEHLIIGTISESCVKVFTM